MHLRARLSDDISESSREAGAGYVQPRPAFGRRPWFAFLRRARSLRRFAFAIAGGIVPGRRPYPSGLSVIELRSESWSSGPVLLADSFVRRLLGLTLSAGLPALLVHRRSVHGFGMRRALGLLLMDQDGAVIGRDVLAPGALVSHRSAAWILEIDLDRTLPSIGSTVVPFGVGASVPRPGS